jgi:hypothetical protein
MSNFMESQTGGHHVNLLLFMNVGWGCAGDSLRAQ